MKNGNGNGNGKPRIALIHYSGPPIISGVELVMRDQARLFRFFNYKVSLVLGLGKQFRKDIPVHIIKKMSSTHPDILAVRKELKANTFPPAFTRIEKNLYKRLKDYIIKNNVNICIVHNVMTRHYNLPLTAALIRLSGDMPNVHFITWVHDTTFSDASYFKIDQHFGKNYPWSLLVSPLDNWTYVCISEFRRKELVETFGGKKPKKLLVIPNGIDVEKFLVLSPQMRQFYAHIGGLEADLIAVTPVRLVRRKNLALGIRIAKEIVNRGINFKYIITGYKDQHQENQVYYQELKALVKKLGLENNVFFLAEYLNNLEYEDGQKKRLAVPVEEVYEIADFLLMTSTIEGFGLPLLEAGLARTPIFTSDIKPFHEIGTTNINYFSLSTKPGRIASGILSRMEELPQAYFYRKVIKKYSLRSIFQKQILPLIASSTT